MSKAKKIIKVVAIAISFAFIALSGIEVISGLIGDVSLFGFDLTQAQQKVTHYITSGGVALLGSVGVLVNEFLNKKLKESRDITNTVLEKFLTLSDKYETLKTEVNKVGKESSTLISQLTQDIYSVKNDMKELIELTKIELETKLSNPLIDKKAKELIEGAINGKQETII